MEFWLFIDAKHAPRGTCCTPARRSPISVPEEPKCCAGYRDRGDLTDASSATASARATWLATANKTAMGALEPRLLRGDIMAGHASGCNAYPRQVQAREPCEQRLTSQALRACLQSCSWRLAGSQASQADRQRSRARIHGDHQTPLHVFQARRRTH